MKKEELKKESEECMHNALYWLKLPISKENVEQGGSYILKLLEPREKRIAELEKKITSLEGQKSLHEGILWNDLHKLEKENAELEEKISVLLSCKKCPENKGGFICVKEYENKCLAQKIQYIKELQEENAELKKQLEMSNKVYNDNLDYSHHIEEHLTEAKRLLASWISDKPYTKSELKDLIADTEQFLKDCEVEK